MIKPERQLVARDIEKQTNVCGLINGQLIISISTRQYILSDTNGRRFRMCNDPQSLSADELISVALDESSNDGSETALQALRRRATPDVFEAAKALCEESDPAKRKLGVRILCRLGEPDRRYMHESQEILLSLLRTERDPGVLSDVGWGLGNLESESGILPLSQLKNHPSSEVRLGVVGGMLRQSKDDAIRTLIDLSIDVDDDVRNWATFGLGTQIDADRPDIREALYARLTDQNEETRFEALWGLAARKDRRAIEPLKEVLQSGNVIYDDLLAAQRLGASELLPALLALKESVTDDPTDLDEAIKSCQPNL